MAPWLELAPNNTPEGKLRAKYIDLAVKGLRNVVNPGAPDYLVFGEPSQPLVDAAFLAQGLLRAPKQLWENLDDLSESYINTGSVYLCAVGLLAQGLPATDEFGLEPFAEWTNLKVWSGKEIKTDHAL